MTEEKFAAKLHKIKLYFIDEPIVLRHGKKIPKLAKKMLEVNPNIKDRSARIARRKTRTDKILL